MRKVEELLITERNIAVAQNVIQLFKLENAEMSTAFCLDISHSEPLILLGNNRIEIECVQGYECFSRRVC